MYQERVLLQALGEGRLIARRLAAGETLHSLENYCKHCHSKVHSQRYSRPLPNSFEIAEQREAQARAEHCAELLRRWCAETTEGKRRLAWVNTNKAAEWHWWMKETKAGTEPGKRGKKNMGWRKRYDCKQHWLDANCIAKWMPSQKRGHQRVTFADHFLKKRNVDLRAPEQPLMLTHSTVSKGTGAGTKQADKHIAEVDPMPPQVSCPYTYNTA
jgi:hypothetical protein